VKTIGLIGGMSWESTLEYYRIINEEVNRRLGGWHSAKIVLYSLDFDEIVRLQHERRWDVLGELLAEIAGKLEMAGADFILICTNTMHKVAEYVQRKIRIPLLNIIDCVANEAVKMGLKVVGLLGTRFTMEDGFYEKGLGRYGLDVVIPDEEDRKIVHDIIFKELCKGIILDSSRAKIIKVIERLKMKGAEGVILGCTELPLILKQGDVDVPLLDSTRIHALCAVDHALK
jgi:aspartate racemase